MSENSLSDPLSDTPLTDLGAGIQSDLAYGDVEDVLNKSSEEPESEEKGSSDTTKAL